MIRALPPMFLDEPGLEFLFLVKTFFFRGNSRESQLKLSILLASHFNKVLGSHVNWTQKQPRSGRAHHMFVNSRRPALDTTESWCIECRVMKISVERDTEVYLVN